MILTFSLISGNVGKSKIRQDFCTGNVSGMEIKSLVIKIKTLKVLAPHCRQCPVHILQHIFDFQIFQQLISA